jgi:hypothetical protein
MSPGALEAAIAAHLRRDTAADVECLARNGGGFFRSEQDGHGNDLVRLETAANRCETGLQLRK